MVLTAQVYSDALRSNLFFSFTLKNTGDVQFDYAWSIESGWTRQATELTIEQPEEKSLLSSNLSQVKSIKSARVNRELPPRSARLSLATSKVTQESRGAKLSIVPLDPPTTSTQEPPSRMASASDGRPVSAMALAYDAGSVHSELTGADPVSFTIEPQYGSIKPESTATFTVRFSPLDIMHYNGTLVSE